MDSGWVAVAVGAVALIPAYVGIGAAWVKAGVADGRAERAEERAEGALEAYQRMADALDRISNISAGRVDTAGGPPVSFAVEWRRGSLYTLRNLGPETATGVTIDEANLPIGKNLPDGVTLRPLEGHDFIIVGVFGFPVPPQVIVAADELPEPVFVPIAGKF